MPFVSPIVVSLTLTTSHQQFAAPNDVDGVYSIEIESDTLAAGEVVEVLIEQKVAAGDATAEQLGDPIYLAGPAPPMRQLMVVDTRNALRITAKQFSGTMRTVRLLLKPIG